MKTAPTILLSVALIALPGVFWLEKTDENIWNNRLLSPLQAIPHNLHTPLYTDGTYLPAIISKNLTLSPTDNPIILTQPTTVAPEATLALAAGTRLYALEHGALHIDGTLNIQGQADNPTVLTSNEQHPANRSWSGLIVNSTGRLIANHATIKYAHPGISCLPGSEATINNTSISATNIGLYNESDTCTISHSRIQARQVGIVSTLEKPPLSQITIQAPQEITFINPEN